jgi:glycosyltransferase involved in cell wall biosynthesis
MYKKRITIIEWFEIWPLKYWIRYRGVLIGIAGWSIQLIASQFGTYLTVFTPRAKGALKRLRLGRDKRIRILCGLISQKDLMKNNECERTDIIFLGRLVGEKQPHLAIEAVKMYLEKGWNGEFWLIGQGPLGNELLNKVDSARLNKNIHVIQNATDDFVESKMCKSFLLIHPSRREGYGISIVEAATLGVPALIIDYPDNAAVELQINPKLISKSDNPRELMSLIEYADSNQLELRSESLKWIQKASVNQTMDKSSEQVVRLFEIFRPSH